MSLTNLHVTLHVSAGEAVRLRTKRLRLLVGTSCRAGSTNTWRDISPAVPSYLRALKELASQDESDLGVLLWHVDLESGSGSNKVDLVIMRLLTA